MQSQLRSVCAALIVLGTLTGLWAMALRYRAEMRNRRVEIAVDWQEIAQIAPLCGIAPVEALQRFRAQNVTTLAIAEDTLASLENLGAVRPIHTLLPDGRSYTRVEVRDKVTLERIQNALHLRQIPIQNVELTQAESVPPSPELTTLFLLPPSPDSARTNAAPSYGCWSVSYATLRTLGLGLPPEAVAAATQANLRIAGRISNFAGVRAATAQAVIQHLKNQGATSVIFTGEEVLGYRGLERQIADLFRNPDEARPDSGSLPSAGLLYGAVEFSKQKGDAPLGAALKGDYVRVHSIQLAEMAQIEENEAVERFVRAVKERNIRFCYVRLWTQAGDDPMGANSEYVRKITCGIARGNALTGGGMEFGAARRSQETGVPRLLFGIIALGVAAGTVWLLCALLPVSNGFVWKTLVVAVLLCAGLALTGESGRRLVALLAGTVFPALACVLTYPQRRSAPLPALESMMRALGGLIRACAITGLGIVAVSGLLASRPFLMRANQFFGIKAQHALPIFLIALLALIGGAALTGESSAAFRARAEEKFRQFWNEPARFGLLIVSGIALLALVFLLARTGNDAGVGVSGIEMKLRSLLDRVLPVRPRTKEFLIGHPAFVLALAWWWRGRRSLAIPCFVVGSLGQVSLLNTFCHIHTPLMLSFWRGGLGVLFGTLLGIAAFLAGEALFARSKPETISVQSQ
jgi:hypothetical protein